MKWWIIGWYSCIITVYRFCVRVCSYWNWDNFASNRGGSQFRLMHIMQMPWRLFSNKIPCIHFYSVDSHFNWDAFILIFSCNMPPVHGLLKCRDSYCGDVIISHFIWTQISLRFLNILITQHNYSNMIVGKRIEKGISLNRNK